jgi:chloramphenicol-sensitive protein RarD
VLARTNSWLGLIGACQHAPYEVLPGREERREVSERNLSGVQSPLFHGVVAYVLWGLIPLYFKLVDRVALVEVAAHRVLWSFVLVALLASCLGRWGEVLRNLRNRRVVGLLSLSATLMVGNWLTFIYAVVSGQTLQASLAYFTAPLVTTLLGAAFLRERLAPLQVASMVVAAAGVAVLTRAVGHVPWLALAIGLTGSFYGLVRKLSPVDGFISMAVETAVIAPVAVAYLGVLAVMGRATGNAAGTLGLLMLAGPVTTIPFLFFGRAIRGLRLATIGILQYFTPSIQFLLAVFLFREPFPSAELVSFACIWTAVVMYTADSYWAARQSRPRAIEPVMIDP